MNTDDMQADDLDVPAFLRVENRKPLTPEQKKKVETVMAKAKKVVKAKPAPKPEAKRRADGLVAGSAGAKLVDYVLAAPRTNEELCKMIGWKQCLPFLRKSCDQAGVKLKTEKVEGQRTRYYGMRKKAKAA